MSVDVEFRPLGFDEDLLFEAPATGQERLHEEPDEELELLVVKAQEGDETAAFLVGKAVEHKVHEAVSRYFSNPEDIAALTRDGLSHALEKGLVSRRYSRYYGREGKNGEIEVTEGDFRGWTYAVARNFARTRIRGKREDDYQSRFSEEQMKNLAGPQSAVERAEEREGYHLVNALLESVKMPETHREVIRLRLLGYGFAEIGEILDIPEGTALSRHYRGIRYLRNHFNAAEVNRVPDIFANLHPVKPEPHHEATHSNRR